VFSVKTAPAAQSIDLAGAVDRDDSWLTEIL